MKVLTSKVIRELMELVLFGLSYAWRDDVIYDAGLDPNTTQSPPNRPLGW